MGPHEDKDIDLLYFYGRKGCCKEVYMYSGSLHVILSILM